jgi:hypothetical protein
MTVVQQLPDIVSTVAHDLEPAPRDLAQFTGMRASTPQWPCRAGPRSEIASIGSSHFHLYHVTLKAAR